MIGNDVVVKVGDRFMFSAMLANHATMTIPVTVIKIGDNATDLYSGKMREFDFGVKGDDGCASPWYFGADRDQLSLMPAEPAEPAEPIKPNYKVGDWVYIVSLPQTARDVIYNDALNTCGIIEKDDKSSMPFLVRFHSVQRPLWFRKEHVRLATSEEIARELARQTVGTSTLSPDGVLPVEPPAQPIISCPQDPECFHHLAAPLKPVTNPHPLGCPVHPLASFIADLPPGSTVTIYRGEVPAPHRS